MKPSSPSLGLDKSIDSSFSSESRTRKKDLYPRKKAAPSIIDDPNYFDVSVETKDPFVLPTLTNLNYFALVCPIDGRKALED